MFTNELWNKPAGATGFYSHQIAKSIRADTNNGYLHRTPSSAGNRATWTFSTWIKLAQMGTGTRIIYSGGSSGDQDGFYRLFYNANKLIVSSANANFLTPDNLFRDPSAWQHIVWKQGSNASTLYVNGEQIATASVSGNTAVNNNTIQCIGTSSYGGSPTDTEHLDGYFAETIMIDGTALNPTSFGTSKNGCWIPKEYDTSDGAYGTNGFRLAYGNASDLGEDSAGSNDWTAVNLATHDQLTNTPINNFPTYNPLNKGSYTDLSEGNLRADSNTGADASYPSGTVGFPSSGKWYYEQLIGNLTNSYPTTFLVAYGAEEPDTANRGMFWAMRYRSDTGTAAQSSGEAIAPFGTITVDNTSVASLATGDIVSWYIDMDNKKAWIAKNGSIPNSGDPANGTNPQFSWTENPINGFTFGSQEYQTSYTVLNAGAEPTFAGEITAGTESDSNSRGAFKYAVPTGFLALCTANIPITAEIDPAETDDDHPSKLVKTLRYTGNDGTQTIALGFKPDFLMLNMLGNTGGGYGPQLWDTNRGDDYYMYPAGNANSVTSGSDYVEFVSTGFKLDNNWDGINHSGETYGAIGIRANGGTTSSNSNGSITSTVQVDPSGHFSIGTYTGESASKTVGHGLSSAPDCIVVKATSGTVRNWAMYNRNRGANKVLYWNNTSAEDTSTVTWGNTHPTSTVFSIGDSSETGKSQNYIFYAFANCEGYIRAGTYEGNATTDGPFVYTGFQPVWLLIRYIGTGESWINNTNTSLSYNGDRRNFRFGANAESTGSTYAIDLLSNGFKLRTTWEGYNGNGYVITYLAIGQPFKYGTAV